MINTTSWTTAGFDEAETPVTVELQQIDTVVYRDFTVPVWQVATGQAGNYYNGSFVRYDDLSTDLAEAFKRWQYGAAMPFDRAAYHHDFEIFMSRGGQAEDAEIVRRYL